MTLTVLHENNVKYTTKNFIKNYIAIKNLLSKNLLKIYYVGLFLLLVLEKFLKEDFLTINLEDNFLRYCTEFMTGVAFPFLMFKGLKKLHSRLVSYCNNYIIK